jgi:hypothetical protein
MGKTYKQYCREARKRDPKTYGPVFKEDGSLKPSPKMTGFGRKKNLKQIPRDELSKLPKNGWKPKPKKPVIEITGTEIRIRGRKLDLTIWEMPPNPSRKEYNRVWMHNYRVRQRIKKLRKKYGITKPL